MLLSFSGALGLWGWKLSYFSLCVCRHLLFSWWVCDDPLGLWELSTSGSASLPTFRVWPSACERRNTGLVGSSCVSENQGKKIIQYNANVFSPRGHSIGSNMNSAKHQTSHKYDILEIINNNNNNKNSHSKRACQDWNMLIEIFFFKASVIACTRPHLSTITTHHPHPQQTHSPTKFFK